MFGKVRERYQRGQHSEAQLLTCKVIYQKEVFGTRFSFLYIKFSFSGWNACITTCSDTSVGSEESKWVSTWRPEADYHLLNMYRNSSLCIKSIWCWCPWLFNILDIESFVCTSTSETSCSPPLKSAWFKVPQAFYIQWVLQILQFERVVHQLIVTDYEC